MFLCIWYFRILEHEEKGGYFFAVTDEEIKCLIHSGKTCIMCCKPEVIDTIMQQSVYWQKKRLKPKLQRNFSCFSYPHQGHVYIFSGVCLSVSLFEK